MIRVQVYLEKQDDDWLEERAAATRTSKAALIREGIGALRAQDPLSEDEPLLSLIGHVADDPSGPHDVAERHDHYLIEEMLNTHESPNE